MLNLYLTFLLGAVVLEIGVVYGDEKPCLKNLGLNSALVKYLNKSMECADQTDSWKFVTRGHCSATMGDEVKKKDLIACQLHCDGETLHKLTFNGVTGGCKCCPKWSNVEQVDLDGVVFVREGAYVYSKTCDQCVCKTSDKVDNPSSTLKDCQDICDKEYYCKGVQFGSRGCYKCRRPDIYNDIPTTTTIPSTGTTTTPLNPIPAGSIYTKGRNSNNMIPSVKVEQNDRRDCSGHYDRCRTFEFIGTMTNDETRVYARQRKDTIGGRSVILFDRQGQNKWIATQDLASEDWTWLSNGVCTAKDIQDCNEHLWELKLDNGIIDYNVEVVWSKKTDGMLQ